MGTDNKIDACYMTQAQNLFKKLGLNPKGVKVKEEAMQLFSGLSFGASKYLYIETLDTDKDGNISVLELAGMYERADKKGRSGKLVLDNAHKKDGITDKTEITSDFVQYGAIPYLLSEAKKYSPEKYAQIEQRLKMGTFSITGEKDYNMLEQKQEGKNLASLVSVATGNYESLTLFAPNFKKMFFENLAQGKVPEYKVMPEVKGVAVVQDELKKVATAGSQINEKEKTYSIDNPQKVIINESQHPVSKLEYPTNPSLQTLDADPLEKTAAWEICKKVLTPQQLEDYYKDILTTVNDKEKFARYAQDLGAKINQTLNINPSLVVTDKKLEDKAGFYDPEKNEVTLSSASLKDLQASLESAGVAQDKIKQELLRWSVEMISHEYLHAAQYAFTKKPPQNATKEEMAVIDKYAKNFKEYLDSSDSIALYGSSDEYAKQPIEKSTNDLMVDIDQHIKNWLENKKSKPLLTKTLKHAKQGV